MLEVFDKTSPQIDTTAFVHPTAVVIGNVTVGPGSSIWPNATLRGDDGSIRIGSQSSIQDGTVIHMTRDLSDTVVGDRVTVGHNVILHGCTVEDECIIGMGAIILDNAVVERGSIVGAGALVPQGKHVPAGSVVVGNPFKIIRTCTERDIESIGFSWREYVERTKQYRLQHAD